MTVTLKVTVILKFTEKKNPARAGFFFLHHLFISSLIAADCFYKLHSLFHRRFGKESPFLEFFQHAGTLIFLFKALNCTVNRFIFINYNAYQVSHLLKFFGCL